MNYTTPVLKLTGLYKTGIDPMTLSDIEGSNSNNSQVEILFTFIANTVEILYEGLIPYSLIPYKNDPTLLTEKFNKWFNKRIMTTKRSTETKLIKEIIFSRNEDVSNFNYKSVTFSSIADKYWISPQGVKLTELEYETKRKKLYEKSVETVDDFGKVCFTKNRYLIKHPDKIKVNINKKRVLDFFDNINYCLGGVTNKRWVYRNNKLYLLKQRNSNYAQEPINEILATKVLDSLKLPYLTYVKYSLDVCGFELCSVCENFLKEDEEFIPMIDLLFLHYNKEETLYERVIACLITIGIENAVAFIDAMIAFDRATLNFDRHLGNFGVIRNLKTGKITMMAPLFDMGSCFFNNYQDNIEISNDKNVKKKDILFLDRIKYLEANGKIPALSEELIESFKEDLQKYIYTNKDKDNLVISKIIARNELVKEQLRMLAETKEEVDRDMEGKESDKGGKSEKRHSHHKSKHDVSRSVSM